MPSIKKRVSGFIRQFSSPHTTGPGTDPRKRSPHSPPPPLELCFISRYLGGEARPPGPEIAHGKTGYQLPSLPLANLDPEVFAAFTGPSGGLTCIRRKPPEDPERKENSEDLDYIDLDGARGVSRRPSVSEAFGPLESLAQPGHSLSQPPPPPPASLPPTINGFKDRRSPKPAALKVPKSPTNCIDNTVMNIRVGDRVYRVDDRSIKSPLSETPPCSMAMVPEYASSEIVDVDTELDLVETEDGYMPLALARSQGLENPAKAMKRVVIKSPVRTSSTGRRPSSLNLSSKSRASFSSLDSQSSAESLKDSSNPASPRGNGTAVVSQVPLKVSAAQSKSTANVSSNSNPAESDYPELQPVQKHLNSPSAHLNNDTTGIMNKLTVDLKDDISTSIAGVRYWNRPNSAAYGLSDTLYELHPHTGEPAGSPIADTFALVARKNSCIMVLGDGVNWGARAALASRAAVHGAMDYLNQVQPRIT